jgi:hypothetical protein
MKTYQVILTEQGENIFKGGNIEVMRKLLTHKFVAKNKAQAESIFNALLLHNGGSSQSQWYTIREAK